MSANKSAPATVNATVNAENAPESLSISFDFEKFENDKEATAALRQIAEASILIRDFIERVPGGVFALRDVAEALAPIVPQKKRAVSFEMAKAATRYIRFPK